MTETAFMALAQKRYAELQALNKINSFYDYEKEFDKIGVLRVCLCLAMCVSWRLCGRRRIKGCN
jgi:hypothetical protein